jgi:ATP dependent DNA ligase C terminal region
VTCVHLTGTGTSPATAATPSAFVLPRISINLFLFGLGNFSACCLVAQIEFTEWTPDSHLRHSKFVGLREDKEAREVVREIEN